MDWTSQLMVVGAVAYGMVLGGAVGFDRERRNRPAGFRTHMLVAGASALLVGMGRLMVAEQLDAGPVLRIDPLRLVEAVVAGVAFIGAGTIFSQRRGAGVTGITTAASLLMVAVIGIAAGMHYYVLALAVTVLTLLVLAGLKLVERRLAERGEARRREDPDEPA
ncbi:MAG TPA: MgtC/SapB family protein [Xanthomonadaceae bacterium]|nr:MgtC/SapB family protein [Xanthomonadaceae bacterium]